MLLAELLRGFATVDVDLECETLTLDSRTITSDGSVFVALLETAGEELQYVRHAIASGAAAVLYDPIVVNLTAIESKHTALIQVSQLGDYVSEIAARYYGNPAQRLAMIGITGTNGKTSCSQFLAQSLANSALIGTLGWGKWGHLSASGYTTPDAILLQKILVKLDAQVDLERIFIEVSSHALAQGRANALKFNGAVFTNLSRDHLDYHGSMEAYFQSKLKLFQRPELEFAVINLDDKYAERLISSLPRTTKLWTYSRQVVPQSQCVTAVQVKASLAGLDFTLCFQTEFIPVQTNLYGEFNLENLLAVVTTLLALGLDFQTAVTKIANIASVSGRMQMFGGGLLPTVIVDYAHTPDALAKTLQALKQHTNQYITVIFGCGGNRDIGKRLLMGEVASQLADKIVLTDDNPRFEASEDILAAIVSGCELQKVKLISDRKQAIMQTIATVKAGECVLIAGKGHEDYQEINGMRLPFNDSYEVEQALAIFEQELN